MRLTNYFNTKNTSQIQLTQGTQPGSVGWTGDRAQFWHLEPDILECKVKWASGSIAMNKASGGDGIPAKLFQILENAAATREKPRGSHRLAR